MFCLFVFIVPSSCTKTPFLLPVFLSLLFLLQYFIYVHQYVVPPHPNFRDFSTTPCPKHTKLPCFKSMPGPTFLPIRNQRTDFLRH